MIENLIQTLFYTNTRIIIPNFGAFLPNGFDEYGNCKFIFSPNLKFNDGFLIRRLIEDRHVSYADAQAQVENFVRKIQEELQLKRVALLPDFGGFYYDNKNVVHFLFERDMVAANHKIQQFVEKESRGELMDVRLDEFVLLYNKTAVDKLVEKNPLDHSIPPHLVSTPSTNVSQNDELNAPQNITPPCREQEDFFDLNPPTPAVPSPIDIQEQLRKAKEVEVLQKKLEELENAKKEYLEKIRKEEEEKHLELLAQQKKAAEEKKIEEEQKTNISKEKVDTAWKDQQKNTVPFVEKVNPFAKLPQEKTQEVTPIIKPKKKGWQHETTLRDTNVEQMFAYRDKANRKRRDALPIILITILLLVIFSTAGFLYFREEITDFLFTNESVKSNSSIDNVIDLNASSFKIYHIVINSFSKKGEAERYLQALKTKNPTIDPQIVPQPGNLYFISIYRYNNEKDADAAIARLKRTIPEVKKIVQK